MKNTCLKFSLLIISALGLPAWNALAATCSVPSAAYPTIQAAVNDASCNTINVMPGVYAENISIGRPLTLLGAQAGQPVAARVSAGPAESTIQGSNPTASMPVILINADHVTVDGFTIKNSVAANAAIGIQLKPISTNNTLTNNIIDGINSLDLTPAGNATAIFVESNGSSTFILQNLIRNISGAQSARGIVLGDGTGAFLDAMDIERNTMTGITSTNGGAYGVLVVNPVIFGGLFFANNDFSNFEGSTLVHGLSFNSAMGVTSAINNNFTNLIGPAEDNKAIWFGSNAPDVYRTDASGNNFNLTIASYAIAIDPSVNVGGNFVNAGCCWWGSPDGPGPVGPGHGARVSPNVLYNGWRLSPDRTSPCSGNNVPTTPDQCRNGGWTTKTRADGSTFKNQGDCMQYTNNAH